MAKKFTTGLSPSGFRNIAKQIREYREDLTDKCEEFAYRMAEEGVSIAQLKILSFDAVMTGELLNSIGLEAGDIVSNGSSYYIYTDCLWASFVEFGTGIVGSENPHPDTGSINWKYDVNKHGEKGWFYLLDGKWHWTKGMPSRPFLYETAQELKDMSTVLHIAREVFGSD